MAPSCLIKKIFVFATPLKILRVCDIVDRIVLIGAGITGRGSLPHAMWTPRYLFRERLRFSSLELGSLAWSTVPQKTASCCGWIVGDCEWITLYSSSCLSPTVPYHCQHQIYHLNYNLLPPCSVTVTPRPVRATSNPSARYSSVMTLSLLMFNVRCRGMVRSLAKSAGRKRETPAAIAASMRFICSGNLNERKVS